MERSKETDQSIRLNAEKLNIDWHKSQSHDRRPPLGDDVADHVACEFASHKGWKCPNRLNKTITRSHVRTRCARTPFPWVAASHAQWPQTKRKRNTPNEGSIQGQFQSRLPEPNGAKNNENAGFIGIRTERTENQIAGLTRSSECVRKLLDHCCPRVREGRIWTRPSTTQIL